MISQNFTICGWPNQELLFKIFMKQKLICKIYFKGVKYKNQDIDRKGYCLEYKYSVKLTPNFFKS